MFEVSITSIHTNPKSSGSSMCYTFVNFCQFVTWVVATGPISRAELSWAHRCSLAWNEMQA